MKRRAALHVAFLAGLLLALLLVPSAQAAGAPEWKLTVTPSADYFLPGAPNYNAVYTIEAENVGTAATSDAQPILIRDTLPAGLTAEGVQFYYDNGGDGIKDKSHYSTEESNDLSEALCPSPLECVFPASYAAAVPSGVKLHQRLIMLIRVGVSSPTPRPLVNEAQISGGGAPAVQALATNEVNASPPFGFHDFSSPLADSSGGSYAQAGGHPYRYVTEFNLATVTSPGAPSGGWGRSEVMPVHDPRDIAAALPPGLLANPQGVPRCALARYFAEECPISTIVGTAGIRYAKYQGAFIRLVPVYNLQPAGAYPGELGYIFTGGFNYLITAGLRSGSDYGVTATSIGVPPVALNRFRLTLWGVPADPSHDSLRGKGCASISASGGGAGPDWEEALTSSPEVAEQQCAAQVGQFGQFPEGGPAGVPPTPFLTMPTECSGRPLGFLLRATPWQPTGEEAEAAAADPAVDSCGQLSFEPSIESHPTTDLADTPSGLEFDLHVPQREGCTEPPSVSCEPATPSLSEALVKLPQGLSVNPSSANGLGACSPAQIGLATPVAQTPAHFTEAPAQCPAAALIGTAQVKTPLLHNVLEGGVYLATPRQNPFGSLLAAYIVLEGEGIIVKLPGKIEADPQTGQLTGRFTENPQTPFEDFHLTFFGGARGDLRTPATCGSYETTSQLTPYSHTEVNSEGETVEATPIAEPSAEFETTAGPQGGSCPRKAANQPNAPIFRAGTESPTAGAFSPFAFKLRREDGSQEFSKIETTLPPGLVGKLAGVAECSEAQLAVAKSREHEGGGEEEKASPSCPTSSEVGKVEVASGAGPTPFYVTGRAYLAGPYKGAPLSLAIITPAVAGPFDLGDVLVRTALYVEPETAQIKAVSDPIPHILQGIPLDVRSVTLKMDRPNFTLNPTNCNELHFSGSETSLLENVASLSQRFQVGGCSVLPFKPKLKLSLRGKTIRTGHPALRAVLTMKPGEANIARAQVTLPHSEFLDQNHIWTVCTRVQFAEDACPAASVYGHAKAWSPLLDQPLEGPVYLRSSSHELPDLVADLNGQIQVALDGRVDSVNARLRNTFEVVPDAPVSKFVLEMQGNRKGLLVNSTNLCAAKAKNRAIADFTGQNGKQWDTEPVVASKCPKHKGGKGHGHHRRHA